MELFWVRSRFLPQLADAGSAVSELVASRLTSDDPCLHSCNVSERVVTDAAQALVELGLKSVGACACACARRNDKRLLR